MAILRYVCFLCNVLWTICWHYKILIYDVSLDIYVKKLRKKEVAYTIITLPEAKRFLFLSCLSFSFRKRVSVYNFFFDHNVRYGSSVTFRIGVASESLQNLDNHEPQRFDFVSNASQLNKLVNYIITN